MSRTQLDHDRDNEDSLDQALDALTQGDRAGLERLDQETRTTIDHLYAWAALGGLDGVADRAPAYTAAHVKFARPGPQARPHLGRPDPMHATAASQAPIAPTLRNAGRRVAPTLWSAFAWLMIATLAGASLYGALPYLRKDGPANPTMTAFQAGTATPEPAGETGDVNYGGDAGRTWHFGDVEPTTGEATILGNLGPASLSVVSQSLVVGDTIIATIIDPSITDGSAYQTIRYDLTTGERLWTAPYPMFGPFATDGEFLYGLLTFPEENEEVYLPGAVWLDSGQIQMWFENGNEVQGSGAGPLAVDGMGFYADAYGDVSVMKDGDPDGPIFAPYPTGYLGQHPERPGFGVNVPETDLVISDDWLFVVRPSRTIVKYDRHTGEELDSFNLVDAMRGEVSRVTLQAVQGRLVVTAGYADTPADAAEQPASILFFETATLNLVARGDLPDLRSNLVVTPDWIYLAGRLEGDVAVRIYRMNPVGATFGAPFSEFAAPESAWFGLSLSRSKLMVVGPPNAIAQIDIERKAVIQSGRVDLADDDSLTVFPMQMWDETPVAVSTGGDIVVIGESPEGP